MHQLDRDATGRGLLGVHVVETVRKRAVPAGAISAGLGNGTRSYVIRPLTVTLVGRGPPPPPSLLLRRLPPPQADSTSMAKAGSSLLSE